MRGTMVSYDGITNKKLVNPVDVFTIEIYAKNIKIATKDWDAFADKVMDFAEKEWLKNFKAKAKIIYS